MTETPQTEMTTLKSNIVRVSHDYTTFRVSEQNTGMGIKQ